MRIKNSFDKEDIYKFGLYSFRAGVFLLPSALIFSIIFLLLSSVISVINCRKNLLNDNFNKVFLVTTFLMVISSFIHLYKFSTNSLSEIIMSEWDPNLSFIGLLNWIPLFWCFLTFQIYLDKPKHREICAKCFIFGVIPVIISGIGQIFFKWEETITLLNGLIIWYQKELLSPPFGLTGLFSNPNYAGAWFNITLPFSVAYLIKSANTFFKKYLISFLIIIIVLSIVLTNSRAAWGGIILSFIFIFGRKSLLSLSLVITITMATITLCFFPIFGEGLQAFLQNLIPIDIWMEFSNLNFIDRPSRVDIWKSSIEIIKDHPFFGSGASTFLILTRGLFTHTVNHSHNLPLEIALNYGIPTLILIAGTITTLIFTASRKIFFSNEYKGTYQIYDRAWISSLMILIVSHLVDIQYFDGRISIASWILIAGLRSFLRN